MFDILYLVASVLAWAIEFIAILFCIYGIFGKRIRINKEVIGLIGLDILIFRTIQMGIFPEITTGIVYIMAFLYAIRTFKKKLRETFGRYVLSIVIAGTIQVISTYTATLVGKYVQTDIILILMMNMVSLMLSFFFYKVIARKWSNQLEFRNKNFIVVICVCALCMLVLLLAYRWKKELEQIFYLFLLLLITFVYFYWAKTQKVQLELEKKTWEMKLQSVYGEAYEKLLSEMRRRQHDYLNQIGALYSMHITATSLEDLIAKQREYGSALMEQSKYDKILTGCRNPVLAGYLYFKCETLEQSGVKVRYGIHTDSAECKLALHELIEVLGILLTNAVENNAGDENGQKVIGLTVTENAGYLYIEVSNPAPYIKAEKVGQLFQEGYSTKGEGRGIGLFRVKQLAESCKADFIVENREDSGRNWIHFGLKIPN